MNDEEWLAANSGDGLDIAESYIAGAKTLQEPIEAIRQYLLAIDILRVHIGRMDTESELVRLSIAQASSAMRASPARPEARS